MTPYTEAAEIIVSGSIPEGPTTSNITYFVVDRARGAIVGNITLPDASLVSRGFRLTVRIPNPSESLDVGVFDAAGDFASAGFTVEPAQRRRGAVGPVG